MAAAARSLVATDCAGTVDAPNMAPQVSEPTLPSISSGCPVTSMNRDWKSFTAPLVWTSSKPPFSGTGPQPRAFRRRWMRFTALVSGLPALMTLQGKGDDSVAPKDVDAVGVGFSSKR